MPAISCTAADLAAASKCLCGIASPADRQRVMIYLLQHIAGLDNLTPAELVARAKCLCGIPENRLKAVEVALLCAATGGVPPCPPSGGGAGCTYQDMQVAWTPTNLKLGELVGYFAGTVAVPIQGIVTLVFNHATNDEGYSIGFGPDALQSISFPSLTSIGVNGFGSSNGLNLGSITPLLSISAPLLATVYAPGNVILDNNPALTTLNLNSLTTVGGQLKFDNDSSLVSLNLPALVTVDSNFTGISCTSLTTVNVPNYLPTNGTVVSFANCALLAASVNQILARAVANPGYVTGGIVVNGGTSDAPTGQGIADKATLNARLPGLAVTN